MKTFISFFFFLLPFSLPAQDFSLEDMRYFNTINSNDFEKVLSQDWNLQKTADVIDIPSKGMRNIQFQTGTFKGEKFSNLEKISLQDTNLLVSLFIKDQGETYKTFKNDIKKAGFVPIERNNFLAPFQKLISSEFYSKGEELIQLDTYKDAEGKEYHLILITTFNQYKQYQKLYEKWKKEKL